METVFESVVTALREGRRVEIRRFGSFGTRRRASCQKNIFLTTYRLPESSQQLAGRPEASPKSSVWVGLRPIASDIDCCTKPLSRQGGSPRRCSSEAAGAPGVAEQ